MEAFRFMIYLAIAIYLNCFGPLFELQCFLKFLTRVLVYPLAGELLPLVAATARIWKVVWFSPNKNLGAHSSPLTFPHDRLSSLNPLTIFILALASPTTLPGSRGRQSRLTPGYLPRRHRGRHRRTR